MPWYFYVVGILGLALLMVVHEAGHHWVARAFGMRVSRFSIGFGPALWRHQPRGSDTVYQIALIPFIAYVQIDGMNPFEEVDPEDKGSYANATVVARIATIFAGPLANYLFASVLFFASLMIGGKVGHPLDLEVRPDGAAEAAGIQTGDRVVAIGDTPIDDWNDMVKAVKGNPDRTLSFEVIRDGKHINVPVTPRFSKEVDGGFIGVTQMRVAMPVSEAAWQAVVLPPIVVEATVVGLTKLVTGQEKPEDLMGPVGIVEQSGKAAEAGWDEYFRWLGILSAYFGAFNLVPFPALDGGRLLFLGYEAVTRRRPDARVEARIHMIGLLMLLALITVVSFFDVQKVMTGTGSPESEAANKPPPAPSASSSR